MVDFEWHMDEEDRKINRIVLQDSWFKVGENKVDSIEAYEEGADNNALWFAVSYPYNRIVKVNARYVVCVEYE